MSSFFQTAATRDPDAPPAPRLVLNPWMVGLGSLAGVLVLGGLITVVVGLGAVFNFQDVVLGMSAQFDQAAVTAAVGGVAIVLGAIGWIRRAR